MDQLTLATVDPLADAIAWANKNLYAYTTIVQWAGEDFMYGFHASIALYIEVLRRPHWASKLGLKRTDAQFLIRNALRADLARYIMRENPELEGAFRTCEAKADRWQEAIDRRERD